MNVEDLPDSDSSDEDYIPDGKTDEVLSEVDSDGDLEDPLSDMEGTTKSNGKKRTKKVNKSKKKAKVDADDEVLSFKEENNKESEEHKKKKVDDLWADFMKDTGFKPKSGKADPSSTQPNKNSIKTQQNTYKQDTKKQEQKTSEKQGAKIKITQIFEFAGEEVKVEKEVDPNSAEARLLANEVPKSSKARTSGGLSGIGNVLSQLGKKQKISTLEKTKLDWDRFKKEENIEEELQIHNKGKDGFLERQDFLQRADLRRFEIERDIRNVERAKRFNST